MDKVDHLRDGYGQGLVVALVESFHNQTGRLAGSGYLECHKIFFHEHSAMAHPNLIGIRCFLC
jgi:hypothetical protein